MLLRGMQYVSSISCPAPTCNLYKLPRTIMTMLVQKMLGLSGEPQTLPRREASRVCSAPINLQGNSFARPCQPLIGPSLLSNRGSIGFSAI